MRLSLELGCRLPLPESDGLSIKKKGSLREESAVLIIIAENRCSAGKAVPPVKPYLSSSLRRSMG